MSVITISVHFHGLRECSTWLPRIGLYSRHWVPGCETNVSCLARPWWDSRAWRNEPNWAKLLVLAEWTEWTDAFSSCSNMFTFFGGKKIMAMSGSLFVGTVLLWLSVCALRFTLASPHETAWRLEWIGLSTNLGSSYIEAWDDEDINCIRSSTQPEYFEPFEHLENFIHFKLQPAFK
jgi:hypothetical protein